MFSCQRLEWFRVFGERGRRENMGILGIGIGIERRGGGFIAMEKVRGQRE